MSSDSIKQCDHAANLTLRKLHQVIAGHIDVDDVAPLLYQKNYLSLNKLQFLQNPRAILTDQEKKEYLLNNVLMNGGYVALSTLLDVLDETSQKLQSHATLAGKLRKEYQDMCNQIDQGLVEEPQIINDIQNASTSAHTAQSLHSQIPDIIPEVTSQCDRHHSSASTPAYNYFITVSGTFNYNPSYHSSSLNDGNDYIRQDSSSKASTSYPVSISVTIHS